jgi:hypothetical protein
VTEFKALQTANGKLAARRQQQALAWMWERIDAGLKQAFRQHPPCARCCREVDCPRADAGGCGAIPHPYLKCPHEICLQAARTD